MEISSNRSPCAILSMQITFYPWPLGSIHERTYHPCPINNLSRWTSRCYRSLSYPLLSPVVQSRNRLITRIVEFSTAGSDIFKSATLSENCSFNKSQNLRCNLNPKLFTKVGWRKSCSSSHNVRGWLSSLKLCSIYIVCKSATLKINSNSQAHKLCGRYSQPHAYFSSIGYTS